MVDIISRKHKDFPVYNVLENCKIIVQNRGYIYATFIFLVGISNMIKMDIRILYSLLGYKDCKIFKTPWNYHIYTYWYNEVYVSYQEFAHISKLISGKFSAFPGRVNNIVVSGKYNIYEQIYMMIKKFTKHHTKFIIYAWDVKPVVSFALPVDDLWGKNKGLTMEEADPIIYTKFRISEQVSKSRLTKLTHELYDD